MIKSFNSRLQGGVPKTLHGISTQLAAGLRMIHNLTGKDGLALGGFRIEVTVKTPSLREATRLVQSTNFLDPAYWLGLGDGPHAGHLLKAKLVNRDSLLANANWVYHQATGHDIFHGYNSDKATKAQIQALTDVLNAIGWNSGLRSPTKSLAPNAWWSGFAPTDLSLVFHSLSLGYQTDEQIQELFNLARTSCQGGCVPCKKNPEDDRHRYQVNNRVPFRVRCCIKGCFHKLQRVALIHWIAELVVTGRLDEESLRNRVEEAKPPQD